jgi:hypothetical protein
MHFLLSNKDRFVENNTDLFTHITYTQRDVTRKSKATLTHVHSLTDNSFPLKMTI